MDYEKRIAKDLSECFKRVTTYEPACTVQDKAPQLGKHFIFKYGILSVTMVVPYRDYDMLHSNNYGRFLRLYAAEMVKVIQQHWPMHLLPAYRGKAFYQISSKESAFAFMEWVYKNGWERKPNPYNVTERQWYYRRATDYWDKHGFVDIAELYQTYMDEMIQGGDKLFAEDEV